LGNAFNISGISTKNGNTVAVAPSVMIVKLVRPAKFENGSSALNIVLLTICTGLLIRCNSTYMVTLPDAKLSPYISTKDPPNDGPVDGEILENIGEKEISKMSDLDSPNVEEQYNEISTGPISRADIGQAAREGLLNVAKELEINEPELLENLQVYTKSGERVAGCGTLKKI